MHMMDWSLLILSMQANGNRQGLGDILYLPPLAVTFHYYFNTIYSLLALTCLSSLCYEFIGLLNNA